MKLGNLRRWLADNKVAVQMPAAPVHEWFNGLDVLGPAGVDRGKT